MNNQLDKEADIVSFLLSFKLPGVSPTTTWSAEKIVHIFKTYLLMLLFQQIFKSVVKVEFSFSSVLESNNLEEQA